MHNEQITIQKATIADAPALLALSKETFFEFFGPVNDPANMEAYSATAFTLQKMLEEISNPGSEFYFGLLFNRVIGYLKVNFDEAQTELRANDAMEVERIYLAGEHHGKRFGNQLLTFAEEIAKDRKLKYVWLGVWEHNHKAINFYTRNGYSVFSSHEFLLGDDRQTDLLMKKQVSSS